MSLRRPFALFSLVRYMLYPFALIYGVIVWLRNRLYDAGFSSSIEFSIPVICVGNLSVGGTGKTPHVEYLIRLLQYQYRVATMSRGYRRSTQGFVLANEQSNALRIGDEPMQYHIAFPEVAVSVAEERMTGIPLLLQRRPDIDVIILDDAFQHRSVKAGLNILITDYAQPFYNDYILPYGRLREGRDAYKRAQAIIVSKCPAELSRDAAEAMVRKINPAEGQHVFFSAIRYGAAYDLLLREPVKITDMNIVLVCCIARPEPLVVQLKSVARDVHVLSYQDHHYFLSRDLEEIRLAYHSWKTENKIIVTTEKDATRLLLHRDLLAGMKLPVAVLPIQMEILFDRSAPLNAIIEGYVSGAQAEHQWMEPQG